MGCAGSKQASLADQLADVPAQGRGPLDKLPLNEAALQRARVALQEWAGPLTPAESPTTEVAVGKQVRTTTSADRSDVVYIFGEALAFVRAPNHLEQPAMPFIPCLSALPASALTVVTSSAAQPQ